MLVESINSLEHTYFRFYHIHCVNSFAEISLILLYLIEIIFRSCELILVVFEKVWFDWQIRIDFLVNGLVEVRYELADSLEISLQLELGVLQVSVFTVHS